MTRDTPLYLLGRPELGGRPLPNVPMPEAIPTDAPTNSGGGPLPNPRDMFDDWEYLPDDVKRRILQAAHANRPLPKAPKPRYGVFYDKLGTTQAWRNLVQYVVNGTILPSTTAAVNVAVTLPAGFEALRLNQYPGATLAFLVIRSFSYSATAGSATGALTFIYYDTSGNPVPLGVYSAGNPYDGIMDVAIMSPTPVSDPTNPTLGQLSVSMTNGGTPVTLAWQMGFSVAYLLPEAQDEGV